jgi:octaprenyl-diphosphate synthase
VLDYASDTSTLGKNLGDDLAEGKATLPLIHAMACSDNQTQARLRAAIQQGDIGALPDVLHAIHATGGLEYSCQRASDYAVAAEHAIAGITDNTYVAALRGLTRYAVSRES